MQATKNLGTSTKNVGIVLEILKNIDFGFFASDSRREFYALLDLLPNPIIKESHPTDEAFINFLVNRIQHAKNVNATKLASVLENCIIAIGKNCWPSNVHIHSLCEETFYKKYPHERNATLVVMSEYGDASAAIRRQNAVAKGKEILLTEIIEAAKSKLKINTQEVNDIRKQAEVAMEFQNKKNLSRTGLFAPSSQSIPNEFTIQGEHPYLEHELNHDGLDAPIAQRKF